MGTHLEPAGGINQSRGVAWAMLHVSWGRLFPLMVKNYQLK